jgi:phosphatidylinositol alpha-mannosyltransferase
MARLYHQADLLLAPSHSPEGFGLPFAEALASGLPAVATAIPSYLSLSEVRDYAWFVPEGDAEAMAKGVKKLLLDVPYRRRLNKRGPSVVRARFNKTVVAQRLESSFERWLIGQ